MDRSILQFIKQYKWSVIGFLTMLLVGILFITLGFWATVLIVFLCLIGVGIGYLKDRNIGIVDYLKNLK